MALSWDDAVYLIANSRIEMMPDHGQRETRVYMLDLSDGDYDLQDVAAMSDLPKYGDAHPDDSVSDDIEVKSVIIEPGGRSPARAHITIEYGPVEDFNRKNIYGEIWEWGLSTQQQHITSVAKYGEIGPQTQNHFRNHVDPSDPFGDKFAPICIGRAIGADGDKIDGTDIYSPSLSLKVSCEWESDDSDNLVDFYTADGAEDISFVTWLNRISSGLGCVDYSGTAADGYSVSPWIAGHHTLFIGASNLGRRADGKWGVTYEFLIARNPSDPAAGQVTVTMITGDGSAEQDGVISGVRGWDYLWYTYATQTLLTEPGVWEPTDPPPGSEQEGYAKLGTIEKTVIMEAHLARPYPHAPEDFSTLLGIRGSY